MNFPTFCCFVALASFAAKSQAQTTQNPNSGSTAGSAASSRPGNNWLPAESQFRKFILDEDQTISGKLEDTLKDPMELSVAKDGRIVFVERAGIVKMWSPTTRKSSVIATLKTFTGLEDGLLGVALDPRFTENGWVYVNRSLPETTTNQFGKAGVIRVSRFTLKGDELDLSSETPILDIPTQREQCCHVGGSLAFDVDGNLYASVGDNTNPFESDGFSPHDDRPGRSPLDAQKSAANPNSLTGKILRVKPKASGGYEIPVGNLFPPGTAKTRPEIFVMGNRNPFRISIDPKTRYLYWGEVGPDAGSPDPKRGAAGFDEINQARKAGFFGWPYFVADNKPYVRIDFVERQTSMAANAAYAAAKKPATNGVSVTLAKPSPWPPADFIPVFFDPLKPVNRSAYNTGIEELPPAQPAFIYYPHSLSSRFPEVNAGGGRTAMAGPVYYFDRTLNSPHKLPEVFDHTLFIYEWSRNWIIAVKLDENDQIAKNADGSLKMKRLMPGTTFKRPMDLELGPDGCLYGIEFGTNWGDNKDSKLFRIEFVGI
ncbi:MAG: glycosyl hydrolase [Pedosphaera sp.]|nr:glycosyl hydrolase [Pedosphaera sp.]